MLEGKVVQFQHAQRTILRQLDIGHIAALRVGMAFDDDLAQIVTILGGEQHAHIGGEKTIQQRLPLGGELRRIEGEEHGAFQHDVAVGGIHRGTQAGAGKRLGQIRDDLGAHAYDVVDLLGLGGHGFLLGIQNLRGGVQSELLGGYFALKDDQLVTSGGRVLGVTATADTLEEAVAKAYANVEKIRFEKAFYRRDIGRRALEVK